MITTRLLTPAEFPEYADWLHQQDSETLKLYFGMAVSDTFIDQLVNAAVARPDQHNFLIAEDSSVWVGSVHIAEANINEVEFGIIVDSARRKQGIGDQLLGEAILWARNRGYRDLFMSCLTWNTAIRRLCQKHRLDVKTLGAESETHVKLPPPTLTSVGQEYAIKSMNLYRMVLQNQGRMFSNILG